MSDREGEKLGNYQLMRFLGAGSFADVYLGEHVYLKRQAAIKVLRTRLSKDDMDGFLIEARTIADLEHPNIVQVLDFGVESNVPFLVMSYAPNGTLRQRHPEGIPLAPTIVLPYVKQIASALQYAHDKKLIHRDIKPHNLLLNPHNQVWISDFGLVLIAQSTMSQVTQNPAGTPAYMAPEQFAGKPRPASDQYALGVVIYEWLCGERPFHGTYSELFSQHNFIPAPPLREKIPEISPAVEEVVLTALAKDPYKRFASVKAFANALEQACKSEPYLLSSSDFDLPAPFPQVEISASAGEVSAPESLYSAAPTAPPLRAASKAPMAAEASIAPASEVSSPVAQAIQTPTSQPAAADPEMASPAAAAPSPEESHPAKVTKDTYAPGLLNTSDPAPAELYTERANRDQPLSPDAPTIGDAPEPSQSASPLKRDLSRRTVVVGLAGTVVALGGGALVWRKYVSGAPVPTPPPGRHPAAPPPVPLGTTVLTYTAHQGQVKSVAWSPNGGFIASVGGSTAEVWGASTGKNILSSPYSRHSRQLKSVAWSPDGQFIASGGEDAVVHVWYANSGEDRIPPYTRHARTVRSVAWSPDGKFIASGSEDFTVHVWDATTGGDIFSPYTGHTQTISAVAWSPDGKFIASAGFDKTVQLWNATNKELIFTYRGHTDLVRDVAWSLDGKLIASSGSDKTVQVWNAQTNIGQLIPNGIYRGHTKEVQSVAWSLPDGKYIVSGSFDATAVVWEVATGQKHFTYRQQHKPIWSVVWSPRGQMVASGSEDETVQIWKAL